MEKKKGIIIALVLFVAFLLVATIKFSETSDGELNDYEKLEVVEPIYNQSINITQTTEQFDNELTNSLSNLVLISVVISVGIMVIGTVLNAFRVGD